eukprot:XP_001701143.1 predicted protein [Chlamydomonas reinhardtii]
MPTAARTPRWQAVARAATCRSHVSPVCVVPRGAGRQGTPPVGVGGALGMTRPVPWTEGTTVTAAAKAKQGSKVAKVAAAGGNKVDRRPDDGADRSRHDIINTGLLAAVPVLANLGASPQQGWFSALDAAASCLASCFEADQVSIYILDGEGQGSILAGVGVEPRLCSGAWQNACVPQLCLEQLEQLQAFQSAAIFPRPAQARREPAAMQAAAVVRSLRELAMALAPVVWARISSEPSLRDEWAVLAAHLKKAAMSPRGASKIAPIISIMHERLKAAQISAVHNRASEMRKNDLHSLKLLDEVGRGGYGVVYRGLYHGSEVAVKVIHENLHDAIELVASVSISHPNISPGLGQDVGSDSSMALVMEYCDAGNLSLAIGNGLFLRQLTPTTSSHGTDPSKPMVAVCLKSVFATLLEIALALRHMHMLHLVHCDLKPQNVLLKVFMGERPLGAAVDIYAFGILMHQVMCGVRLYEGLTAQQIAGPVALVFRKQQQILSE